MHTLILQQQIDAHNAHCSRGAFWVTAAAGGCKIKIPGPTRPNGSQSTLARPRVLVAKCDFFFLRDQEITLSLARLLLPNALFYGLPQNAAHARAMRATKLAVVSEIRKTGNAICQSETRPCKTLLARACVLFPKFPRLPEIRSCKHLHS
jgi:hypothetical protein